MKRFILLTLILLAPAAFVVTPLIAETWQAVTKDNEITTKEMVQVKRTVTKQADETYTLKHVNAKIAALEADLDEWKVIKIAIEPIADGVQLKVEE